MSDRDRDRWVCVQRLFESALEREGQAREQYLEEACAGDSALLGEVASLLAADQRGHVALDRVRLDLTSGAGERGGRPPHSPDVA